MIHSIDCRCAKCRQIDGASAAAGFAFIPALIALAVIAALILI